MTLLATRENTEADLIKPRRLAWTVDWGDPSTLRTGVALPQVQRPEQVLFPYQGMNFSTLNGFGGYGNLRPESGEFREETAYHSVFQTLGRPCRGFSNRQPWPTAEVKDDSSGGAIKGLS